MCLLTHLGCNLDRDCAFCPYEGVCDMCLDERSYYAIPETELSCSVSFYSEDEDE